MLVLTRRVDESFTIGDDITIKVVRVAGNQVRIGIDAPNSYDITRGEIKHEHGRKPAPLCKRA